jgi:hypothetical protein
VKRREFIGLLGGVASTWPMVARAQQRAGNPPRVGAILTFRNENFEAFQVGLRDAGYVDHQNMLLEARFFEPPRRAPRRTRAGSFDKLAGCVDRCAWWLLNTQS